jgi:hypothetical protein
VGAQTSAMGVSCQYAAVTARFYDYRAGWFFLGTITMMAGGGASDGGIGGGYTQVNSENTGTSTGGTYFGLTAHAPIVPGTLNISWSGGEASDDGRAHALSNIILPNGTVVGTVTLATGHFNLTGPLAVVYCECAKKSGM